MYRLARHHNLLRQAYSVLLSNIQQQGLGAAAWCWPQQHGMRNATQLDNIQGVSSHRSMSSLTPENVRSLSASFNAPPHSLHHERPRVMPLDLEHSFFGRLALKMLMYDDIKNQLIISGQLLYEDIKEQVDDFALQRAFGMDPKVFYSTFTLLSIHVWLIVHRLGHNPDRDMRFFVQRFYNQFQHDVEKRIYEAGIMVGVSKWTKKLETVFYNSSLEFDQVLHKQSNETFENIILRKFFGGDASKRVQAQLIAKYLLYELECLKMTDKEDIMKGHIQFSRAPFERYRSNKPLNTQAASSHGAKGSN